MKSYRPIMRTANCGGGYEIIVAQDAWGDRLIAGLDLNSLDGTPAPRLVRPDGETWNIDADFLNALQNLPDSRPVNDGDRETFCGPLYPEEPPLNFRATLDFGYTLSPEGKPFLPFRALDGQADTFFANSVEVGASWNFSLTSETFIRGGLDAGLSGGSYVPAGGGLQLQSMQPGAKGFLEILTRGFFLAVGIRDSDLGVERSTTPDNFTVSRSLTHYYGLPSPETGLRLGYRRKSAEFTLGVVNGYDNFNYPWDNNDHPSFLTSLALFPVDNMTLRVGGILGPEKDGNTRDWRYLANVQFSYAGRPLGLMLNFVHGSEQTGDKWDHWNAFLAAARVHPEGWPVGAFGRFEGFDDTGSRLGRSALLLGATVGLNLSLVDHHPVGKAGHRVELRSEFRSDWELPKGNSTAIEKDPITSVGFSLFYQGEVPFYRF